MTSYSKNWDLSTIPADIWASESGRRRRAMGPAVTNVRFSPCRGCTVMLTSREQRKACPHCGVSQRTGKAAAVVPAPKFNKLTLSESALDRMFPERKAANR